MNHARVFRTVLGITVAYSVVLVIWLGWLSHRTPPGTLPMQVFMLVGLFGSFLGIGLLLAQRPPRSDRHLLRHGLEGWATIEGVHPLLPTDHCTELTELDLELVVPGSEPYHGSIVFDVQPVHRPKIEVGETFSIRVDPDNRDRIIVCL
ncbi:hypothetical protein HLB23_37545 [Nocardia uniformis]|uniref:Uncharacterized protein n=1 Tax=Nocardia uniformis TaxID=53432 RepID=A0A849CFB9_9NOCA|nr:hypothetical protein [Nocardia uniformis]NNH75490.1 hypothetical protein [Nocardia uniformis]